MTIKPFNGVITKIDLQKNHPFLDFMGGAELECAAQKMYEIYKTTGRRVFTLDDFIPGFERSGIYEWNNNKYIIKDNVNGIYKPTDFFFEEVERLIKEKNPEYGRRFGLDC